MCQELHIGADAELPNVAPTIRVKVDKKDTENTTGPSVFMGRSTGTCQKPRAKQILAWTSKLVRIWTLYATLIVPPMPNGGLPFNKINSNGFPHRSRGQELENRGGFESFLSEHQAPSGDQSLKRVDRTKIPRQLAQHSEAAPHDAANLLTP